MQVDQSNLPQNTFVGAIEHPRIAYRKGFDNKGYIVWHRKFWSRTTTDSLRVIQSDIGIAAFKVNDFPDAGNLLAPSSTSSIQHFNFGITGGTGDNKLRGPECPSVAISPDKGVWLAFYALLYDFEKVANGFVYHGMKAVPARWYVVSGKSTVTSSVASFTFLSSGQEFAPAKMTSTTVQQVPVQGLYDANRGRLIAPDFYDNTNSLSQVLDLSSGPSIQVAVDKPFECNTYHVGVVLARGNNTLNDFSLTGIGTNDLRRENTKPASSLLFFSGKVDSGQTAADWVNNLSTIADPIESDIAPLTNQPNPTDNDDCSNLVTFRFFPVLKYTNIEDVDPNTKRKVFDYQQQNAIPRSYFVLSYMRGARCQTGQGFVHSPTFALKVRSVNCRTAVAFDNERFFLTRSNAALSADEKVFYVRDVEDSILGRNFLFRPQWAGSKIDVCGDYGNFDVNPIWVKWLENSIDNDPTSGSGLRSAIGACILAYPLLDRYPVNDPEAIPQYSSTADKRRFLTTDLDWNSNTTNHPINQWTAYGYFNTQIKDDFFNTVGFLDKPKGISAGPLSSGSTPIKLSFMLTNRNGIPTPNTTWKVKYGQNTYNDGSLPATTVGEAYSPTASIANGVYIANYADQDQFSFGLLGYSHQRKVVTTGNLIHLVFEQPVSSSNSKGKVFYAIRRGAPYSEGFLQPTQLPVPSHISSTDKANLHQLRPSIAVYEFSGDSGYCGKAAVGITWLDYYPKTVGVDPGRKWGVRFMTREFDLCTGEWAPFSEVYTVDEYWTKDGQFQNNDDSTAPVIAPFIKSNSAGLVRPDIDRGYLLGWTVTWNGYRTETVGSDAVIDRTPSTRDAKLFSRTWLRTNSSGLVLQNNESWGVFLSPSHSNYSASNAKGLRPPIGNFSSSVPLAANVLVSSPPQSLLSIPPNPRYPIRFPSVTCGFSKARRDNGNFSWGHQQHIAYSADGTRKGVFALTCEYYLTPPSGREIGDLVDIESLKVAQNMKPLEDLSIADPNGAWASQQRPRDRNPSITMSSSGQIFVAWEHMETEFQVLPNRRILAIPKSSIMDVHTWTGNYIEGWKNLAGWGNVRTNFITRAGDDNWSWLLNPTLSGHPNSRLFNVLPPGGFTFDRDPAVVELAYQSGGIIKHNIFFEKPASRATKKPSESGSWFWPNNSNNSIISGIWPQKSFGFSNAGPTYQLSGGIPQSRITYSFQGRAYTFANDPSSFATLNTVSGSFKVGKGMYDTVQSVHLYRSEERAKDSSTAKFVWGQVYLNDGVSTGQLVLGESVPDSGFSGHDQMRDSLFRTANFDWLAGEELSYWRGLFLTDSECVLPGGSFYDNQVKMKYFIELMHEDTLIKLIDVVEFDPVKDKWVSATKMNILNSFADYYDVYLRVRGEFTNLSEDDSLVTFSYVAMDTTEEYAETIDSSMALWKKGVLPAVMANRLSVLQPYPNPIGKEESVKIMAAYPKGGLLVCEIRDELGRLLTSKSKETSGAWQQVELSSPVLAGSYIVTIIAGDERKSFPLVVVR